MTGNIRLSKVLVLSRYKYYGWPKAAEISKTPFCANPLLQKMFFCSQETTSKIFSVRHISISHVTKTPNQNKSLPNSLNHFQKAATKSNDKKLDQNPNLNFIQQQEDFLQKNHPATSSSQKNATSNILPPQLQPSVMNNAQDLSRLQSSIIQQQKLKQRKTAVYSFFIILLGSFFGYTIFYKVLYLNEESFWPLFPVQSTRELTPKEMDQLDIESMYELAQQQALFKLQLNDMVKKRYTIPLKISQKEGPHAKNFDKIWFQDSSPDTFQFKILRFKPYDVSNYKKGYHSLGHWIQFKIETQRFMSLKKLWNNILGNEEVYQLIHERSQINGEKSLEEQNEEMMMYRYDPSVKESEPEIWFLNEFKLLEDNSSIIYKGKCVHNCDVSISQIDLVTKNVTDGKMVRYVLYKENETYPKDRDI